MIKQRRTSSSFAKGWTAEILARDFLIAKNYVPMAHRVKTLYGELDLVMMHQSNLVMVEVKQRSNLTDGLQAITLKSQKRWYNAALVYVSALQTSSVVWDSIQFDVVFVGRDHHIVHMPHVLSWQPE